MLNGDVVIVAFSEDQAERLTGLSRNRLRYWDRTGFFKPSLGFENRRVAFSRIYSFKDIVALRTLRQLRDQYSVSLQHLRQVATDLKHLKDELWTKTTLYVINRRVFIVNSETGNIHDALNGQYALDIPLEKVVNDTMREAREFRERPTETIGLVTRARNLSHNAWVIAGTRIPVKTIKRFHEDGYSIEHIISEYPSLTRADVEAAINHEGDGLAA